jgi:ABC-type polysaccharide/polyol phosphate transport system ATPase subunit
MNIITVERVTKRYRLNSLGSKSLREQLARSARRLVALDASDWTTSEELLAVDGVSFSVERGETVGFIGPNGSGKSTILKLLARVTYPTSGQIEVHGSVASLIEIGAGFHPELTGRENIYLYGSIMGMRRAEVRQKFDSIVDFSELHQFVDTPVKYFSSGMYVRLGFAVAAHINPQVLLVDEVLAVGDAAFKRKCLEQIEALRRDGATIVFVSHDMQTVERLCGRVFFLQQGQIRSEGEPGKVIGDYYSTLISDQAPTRNGRTNARAAVSRDGADRAVQIVDVRLLNGNGEELPTFATGDPLVARIEFQAHRPLADPVFDLLFYSLNNQLLCHFTTALSGEPIQMLRGGGVLDIACDELGLMPGSYRVEAAISVRGALEPCDHKPRQQLLQVLPGKDVRGTFYVPHRWRLLPSYQEAPEAERSGGWSYF